MFIFGTGFTDGKYFLAVKLKRRFLFLRCRIDSDHKLTSFENERIGIFLGIDDFKITVRLQIFVTVAQVNHLTERIEDRIRITFTLFDCHGIFGGIHRQIQIFRRRRGKTAVRTAVPLHGGTGTGTAVTALFTMQTFTVRHTDFIAIIQERYARHQEYKGIGELRFQRCEQSCHTGCIMVTGDKADITLALRTFEIIEIFFKELGDIALAVLAENGFTFTGFIVLVTEQETIAVIIMVKIKVTMESGTDGNFRIAPFGNQSRFGEFLIEHFTDIPPDFTGFGLFAVLSFDERIRHIHTETVTAHTQPETHDILECFTGSNTIGVRWFLLPCRMGDFIEAVIQCRLGTEIVDHVITVTGRNAAHQPILRRCFPYTVRPDITTAVFILFRLLTFQEPFVLVRSMTGYKVEQDTDTLFMGYRKQVFQVLIRAIAGGYLIIVSDIIAGIHKR